MDISVVIVTYNSASTIRDCLASVLTQKNVSLEVIVVDNASSDETLNVVRALKTRTKIIANVENIGFARGCNQGVTASQGKHIYLLNPDAELISHDALAHLLAIVQANPSWGTAGTRLLSADGKPQSPPPATYPDENHGRMDFSTLPGSTAWISGASMIVSREIYDALEGFDPAFFMYAESIDFCLRLRRQGFEVGYVASAEVRHIGGVSEHGRDPYDVGCRRARALHLFWKKNYSLEGTIAILRRERRRALFRMIANGFLACFTGFRSAAWEKHLRYKAYWHTSRQSLING